MTKALCEAAHVTADKRLVRCCREQGHTGLHVDGGDMWNSMVETKAAQPKGMGKTGRNRKNARRKSRRRAEAAARKELFMEGFSTESSWYKECTEAFMELGDTPEGRWWWSVRGHVDKEYFT